jgi:hypothetical protein
VLLESIVVEYTVHYCVDSSCVVRIHTSTASLHKHDFFNHLLAAAVATGTAASTAFVPPVMALPGVVEAENFALGGQGVAYYNVYKPYSVESTEPSPQINNALRNTLISVELLDKAHPEILQYVVAWTAANEWMSYKVLQAL